MNGAPPKGVSGKAQKGYQYYTKEEREILPPILSIHTHTLASPQQAFQGLYTHPRLYHLS